MSDAAESPKQLGSVDLVQASLDRLLNSQGVPPEFYNGALQLRASPLNIMLVNPTTLADILRAWSEP